MKCENRVAKSEDRDLKTKRRTLHICVVNNGTEGQRSSLSAPNFLTADLDDLILQELQ